MWIVSILMSMSETSILKFFNVMSDFTVSFITLIFPVDNSSGIPNFFKMSFLHSTSFAKNVKPSRPKL